MGCEKPGCGFVLQVSYDWSRGRFISITQCMVRSSSSNRTLDCWKEVSEFKASVGQLEQVRSLTDIMICAETRTLMISETSTMFILYDKYRPSCYCQHVPYIYLLIDGLSTQTGLSEQQYKYTTESENQAQKYIGYRLALHGSVTTVKV